MEVNGSKQYQQNKTKKHICRRGNKKEIGLVNMITFYEKWWAFVKYDECKHIRSHFTTNTVLINLVLTKHNLQVILFHSFSL